MCPQCGVTDSPLHRRGIFHKKYDELCNLISQGAGAAQIAAKFHISRQRAHKLIANKWPGDVLRPTYIRTAPMSQLQILLGLMEAGHWHDALRLASKWAFLGPQKKAITRGADALKHPEFHRQLGKNPDKLVAEGIAALKERYQQRQKRMNKFRGPSMSERAAIFTEKKP